MKSRQLLVVTVSLIAVVLLYLTTSAYSKKFPARTGRHKLVAGRKVHNDEMLFLERVTKKPKVGQKVSKDISYRHRKSSVKYAISYYKVEDLGEEGYAYLTSGGIGNTFVSFRLQSQLNKGLNFSIEVYGQVHKEIEYEDIDLRAPDDVNRY